jgi:hypothetical protein
MKTLVLAIALVALAGCDELKETFDGSLAASGARLASHERPDWLRDRGEYPYNTEGW